MTQPALPPPTRTIRVPIPVSNPDQLAIDAVTPAQEEATLQAAFERFHEANPHVYDELVKLARRWKSRGNSHCGMKMLFEVLRFRRGMRTAGENFLLNNNYSSRYTRLVAERDPDLADLFRTKVLKTP